MFLAHAIRLRDPWQCDELEDGALRWTRLFHRPTGLEPDDQLILVINGLPPDTQLTVNGHQLENPPAPSPLRGGMGRGEEAGTHAPSQSDSHDLTQFHLTPILADSNKIELLIPPAARASAELAEIGLAPPGAFPYDARLAIVAVS